MQRFPFFFLKARFKMVTAVFVGGVNEQTKTGIVYFFFVFVFRQVFHLKQRNGEIIFLCLDWK